MWSLCVSFSFPQCGFSTSGWSFCRWWPSIISMCQDMQLSHSVSHPSPLAVCATVRECCLCAMLPEKVAPVSCCRLLSLWVWYYPCWYPHTHTPSRTHVLRYIRPLYSSTLCSFICCGGFLFCCLDSIPSGVVGARTCGVLHTHTDICG